MAPFLSTSARESARASAQKSPNTTAFFSRPCRVALITARPGRRRASTAPPLALVARITSWRLAASGRQPGGEVGGGGIRTGHVEPVVLVVVGAVADQLHDDEIVFLDGLRQSRQSAADAFASGFLADEQDDVRTGRPGMRRRAIGSRQKGCGVARLAAQAGHHQHVALGADAARRQRGEQG